MMDVMVFVFGGCGLFLALVIAGEIMLAYDLEKYERQRAAERKAKEPRRGMTCDEQRELLEKAFSHGARISRASKES